MSYTTHIFSLVEKLLGLEQSEQRVNQVKQDVDSQMNEVTVTLKEAGKLQTRVMKRTTTFYIAKAMGGL